MLRELGESIYASEPTGYKVVKLRINSDIYKINDTEYKFDTKIHIYNDRTFVPIRALSEIIGMNVEWNYGVINIHNR